MIELGTSSSWQRQLLSLSGSAGLGSSQKTILRFCRLPSKRLPFKDRDPRITHHGGAGPAQTAPATDHLTRRG